MTLLMLLAFVILSSARKRYDRLIKYKSLYSREIYHLPSKKEGSFPKVTTPILQDTALCTHIGANENDFYPHSGKLKTLTIQAYLFKYKFSRL